MGDYIKIWWLFENAEQFRVAQQGNLSPIELERQTIGVVLSEAEEVDAMQNFTDTPPPNSLQPGKIVGLGACKKDNPSSWKWESKALEPGDDEFGSVVGRVVKNCQAVRSVLEADISPSEKLEALMSRDAHFYVDDESLQFWLANADDGQQYSIQYHRQGEGFFIAEHVPRAVPLTAYAKTDAVSETPHVIPEGPIIFVSETHMETVIVLDIPDDNEPKGHVLVAVVDADNPNTPSVLDSDREGIDLINAIDHSGIALHIENQGIEIQPNQDLECELKIERNGIGEFAEVPLPKNNVTLTAQAREYELVGVHTPREPFNLTEDNTHVVVVLVMKKRGDEPQGGIIKGRVVDADNGYVQDVLRRGWDPATKIQRLIEGGSHGIEDPALGIHLYGEQPIPEAHVSLEESGKFTITNVPLNRNLNVFAVIEEGEAKKQILPSEEPFQIAQEGETVQIIIALSKNQDDEGKGWIRGKVVKKNHPLAQEILSREGLQVEERAALLMEASVGVQKLGTEVKSEQLGEASDIDGKGVFMFRDIPLPTENITINASAWEFLPSNHAYPQGPINLREDTTHQDNVIILLEEKHYDPEHVDIQVDPIASNQEVKTDHNKMKFAMVRIPFSKDKTQLHFEVKTSIPENKDFRLQYRVGLQYWDPTTNGWKYFEEDLVTKWKVELRGNLKDRHKSRSLVGEVRRKDWNKRSATAGKDPKNAWIYFTPKIDKRLTGHVMITLKAIVLPPEGEGDQEIQSQSGYFILNMVAPPGEYGQHVETVIDNIRRPKIDGRRKRRGSNEPLCWRSEERLKDIQSLLRELAQLYQGNKLKDWGLEEIYQQQVNPILDLVVRIQENSDPAEIDALAREFEEGRMGDQSYQAVIDSFLDQVLEKIHGEGL